MSVKTSELKKLVSAALALKLEEIPSLWLELLEEGWGIRPTVGGLVYSQEHPFTWFDNGIPFGCVCHADPSQPDLTATIQTHVFDQGGSSNCSHCQAEVSLNKPHNRCPGCHRRFVPGGNIRIQQGGSDF